MVCVSYMSLALCFVTKDVCIFMPTFLIFMWLHGHVDSMCGFHSTGPGSILSRAHLLAHWVRCMWNMHLDSFGKNHRLNMPCLTQGNNLSSECSGTPLHSQERQALGISFWPNVAKPGYMCISMYTYCLKPNGLGDSNGHCSNAPSDACSPFSFPFLPFPYLWLLQKIFAFNCLCFLICSMASHCSLTDVQFNLRYCSRSPLTSFKLEHDLCFPFI